MSRVASRARQAISKSTVVVTGDSDIADLLKTDCINGLAVVAGLADSFTDAELILERSCPDILLIDFRSACIQESPAGLLARLARRSTSRPFVVALGNDSYGLEWAADAELAIDRHLPLPVSAEDLAGIFCGDHPPNPLRGTTPWRMEVEGAECSNHTPEMREMLEQLVMMASHDVTLLLVGETGTGKTTLARMVHQFSPRRQEPFQTLACGSVAVDQFEIALYGQASDSVKSASQWRAGSIDLSAGGSLLLDEIDLLGPAQQSKLLRLIETGEYEPAGSHETRHSQVRLIVASNVNLKALMDRAEFRADLYYRLNVLEFPILPLRKRIPDIVPMTLRFVDEFRANHQVRISRVHREFFRALKRYDWPGNIHELKNHIRRAVLFCRTEELTPNELAPTLLAAIHEQESRECRQRGPLSLFEQVASTEQEILEAALRAHGFKRTATAESLGISRVGLYKKMKKYGLLGMPRSGSKGRRASVPLR